MKPPKPTRSELILAYKICDASSPQSLVCACEWGKAACPVMLRIARLCKAVKPSRRKREKFSVFG